MEQAKTGAQSFLPRAGWGRTGGAGPRLRRLRHAQRGVAVVEFALVLPLLLLVLFGIVEVGFLLYDKAIITNASRAAARQAVAFGESASGVAVYMLPDTARTIAASGVSGMLISPVAASGATVSVSMCTTPGSSSSCTANTGCSASGQQLIVAVSYPFRGLSLGSSVDPLASTSGHSLTLNASTSMNCE